jgi:hypothetical protein
MGVAMFGFGLGVILAIGVGTLAGAFAHWLRFSKKQVDQVFGIITLVAAVLLVMPTTGAVIWAFTLEYVGVDPPEADRIIAHWKVPSGAASDLCYFRSARMSEFFDFKISKSDFLKWMQTRGWQPQRYTFKEEWEQTKWTFNGRPENVGCDVDPRRDRDSAMPHYVLDGYCYHERFGERAEAFITIIYDVNEGRAYVVAPN